MSKRSESRFRTRRIKHSPPGAMPGTINVPEGSLKPLIHCFIINPDGFEEKDLKGFAEIKAEFEKSTDKSFWFDIKGLADKEFFEQLSDYFQIHRLEMEDVFNMYQRP